MENNANNAAAMQTEPQTGGAPATQATEPEKMYTQADMDAAIERRLARERKNAPPKEEWEAFRAWKDSQQSEQERQQKLMDERNGFERRVAELEAEIEDARRERFLLQRGIPVDDVDYYAYKIGKLTTDTVPFEKAAEQVLQRREDEPRAKPQPYGVRASFGPPAGASGQTESLSERINRQIRKPKGG